MTTRLFRRAALPAALAAAVLCLPACGKKKRSDDGDGGGGGSAGAPGPLAPSTSQDRRASSNNLKRIALGVHAYMDINNGLPAGVADRSGKAGLSWRVQILPYVEQDALYKQFKLDEPWDSPHNKALVDRMPSVYAAPGGTAPAGHTFYRGFVGPGGMFAPLPQKGPAPRPGTAFRGRNVSGVMDGFSNTLMVVEAGEAVPWTKPDELVYDPKGPAPKVGGVFADGFCAALGDGSTRFISRKVDEETLRAMITADGGEIVDWESAER